MSIVGDLFPALARLLPARTSVQLRQSCRMAALMISPSDIVYGEASSLLHTLGTHAAWDWASNGTSCRHIVLKSIDDVMDPSFTDDNRHWFAVQAGINHENLEQVRYCLDNFASHLSIGIILQYSVEVDAVDILQYILRLDGISVVDYQDLLPYAVTTRSDRVRDLLLTCEIPQPYLDKALNAAVINCDKFEINLLVAHGANIVDNMHSPPLLTAILYDAPVNLLECLLDLGANPSEETMCVFRALAINQCRWNKERFDLLNFYN